MQQCGQTGGAASTGPPDRMSHRKWRSTKQQPSRARAGYQISCCLLSLHFLCDILSGGPVVCCNDFPPQSECSDSIAKVDVSFMAAYVIFDQSDINRLTSFPKESATYPASHK